MPSRAPRWLPWLLGWLLIAAAGAAWLAQQSLARQREAFDTDGRIVHRLLSQRAVQHDAMLGTLALLQPDAAARPEQRLPALQAQVLRVLRRDPGTAWPDGPRPKTSRAACAAPFWPRPTLHAAAARC